MPPLLAWGLHKAELCFPSQAGLSKKKGHSCPSNRNLPRSGLCLPPQTGVCRGQAVPPCSDWGSWGQGSGWGCPDAPPAAEGPSPRRGVHLQAVLPLFLLLLLPAVLPQVHLHGLGGPGLPHTSRAVRQSHGCESGNLQSRSARLFHQVSTRPFPVGPASISPEVCWWGGWSLSGGQAGYLKTQWGGPAPAQVTEAGFKLSAWLARHPMGCPSLRSRP